MFVNTIYASIEITRVNCFKLVSRHRQGCQNWPQSGPDSRQMGQICDFKIIFKSHRFAPFGSNLAHFEAESAIPGHRSLN